MEIESISNKLSNLVENMRGHFNTSPLNEKSLTYKAFLNPFRSKVFTLLPAKLHTQRGAFVGTNPPAGLSLIHSPVLDRV